LNIELRTVGALRAPFFSPMPTPTILLSGERRRGVVAGAATDRSVGRWPFIEIEFLAERDLFSFYR
jgi:hypothetical protein